MEKIREYVRKFGKVDRDELKKLKIGKQHLKVALEKVKPISEEDLDKYSNISKKFDQVTYQ